MPAEGHSVLPQPRRLAPPTAFSEALPRLLPPPPTQRHTQDERAGINALDVTAEPDRTASQTSLSSVQEPLPTSQPFRAVDPVSPHPPRPPGGHLDPPRPPGGSLGALPASHPLRDQTIRDEILAMRDRLRTYLQLKLQQKSVHLSQL